MTFHIVGAFQFIFPKYRSFHHSCYILVVNNAALSTWCILGSVNAQDSVDIPGILWELGMYLHPIFPPLLM